jgi:hypothetical protein
MLHAPTSERKADALQTKLPLVPVAEQELLTHLLHAARPYSFSGMDYTTSVRSPEVQQRYALAGLQTTHGNQMVLRMLQNPQRTAQVTPLRPSQGGLLQRKCACGGTPSPMGECAECKAKHEGKEMAPALFQTKPKVSQPGDQYEQEADRVAEQVMRMPGTEASQGIGVSKLAQSIPLQRSCSTCEEEVRRQPIEEEEKKEEESLQAKELPGHSLTITPALHTRINALRGGGQSLPESTRAFMEPRFGHDFSHVRIHTDARAAKTAQAVNARAYTIGQDLVFGSGQYEPGTSEGQKLLAHELTHTIQQGMATKGLQDGLKITNPSDGTEQEAHAIAFAAVQSRIFTPTVNQNTQLARQVPPARQAPPVPAPKTQWCRPWQTAMLTSHLTDARRWINDAEPKVRAFRDNTATKEVQAIVYSALTDNFHTTSPAHVATIAANFASLRTELNKSFTYECASAWWCKEYAHIFGPFRWVRRLFDINVCPTWFCLPDYFSRVTTLIHERAHQYPGAGEDTYESQQDKYWSLSPITAIDNAESYAVATRQIYHEGREGPGTHNSKCPTTQTPVSKASPSKPER